MIIKVDAEGKTVIEQLCDIALKTYGLSNLEGVSTILKSIELIKDENQEAEENSIKNR